MSVFAVMLAAPVVMMAMTMTVLAMMTLVFPAAVAAVMLLFAAIDQKLLSIGASRSGRIFAAMSVRGVLAAFMILFMAGKRLRGLMMMRIRRLFAAF